MQECMHRLLSCDDFRPTACRQTGVRIQGDRPDHWPDRAGNVSICRRKDTARANVPRPHEARRATTAELIERQSSVWRMELGPAVRG